MYGRISAAPSAQLSPTASGRTWRTEFQNASGVCPESVRPDASVTVPDTITGSLALRRSNASSIAKSAALALRVSNTVSTSRMSTPPSISASAASRYAARELVPGHVACARIVDLRRDRRGAVGRAE
jgi:hypothetical protein